jgi:hypothetical protein
MIRLHLPRFGLHRAGATGFLLLTLGPLAWGVLTGCAEAPSQGGSAELEVVETHWPNGGLHTRRTVMTTGDGIRLNHGPLSVWYETGELRSEGHWRHGQKHGHFVFWHKNGQKAKQFTWTNGRGNGLFIAWDEQGNELRHELWRDGQKIDAATTTATTEAGTDTQNPAPSITPTPHPPFRDEGSARS